MSTLYRITCGLDCNGQAPRHEDGARFLAMAPDYPESPAHQAACARVLVEQLAAKHFPSGHTIIAAAGHWQNAQGQTVSEQTLIVEWIVSDADKHNGTAHAAVSAFASAYKARANQEAVLVTTADVYAVLA